MKWFYLIILIIKHQTKYKNKREKQGRFLPVDNSVPDNGAKMLPPKTHDSPKGFVCNTSEEVFGWGKEKQGSPKGVLDTQPQEAS